MPGYVQVETRWNTAPLTNALTGGAFFASVRDAGQVAKAAAPWPNHVGATSKVVKSGYGILRGTGRLAHIAEGGRAGGYVIQPGLRTTTRSTEARPFGRVTPGGRRSDKVAIKFTKGDQRFYRGPGFLGGPMAPRPYIGPTALAWARGIYQMRARQATVGMVGAAARSVARFAA